MTWFIVFEHLVYVDAIRTISWIVSIYALGDGLGMYLAKMIYGNLSARQTINLAIIFSVIASLLFALAGSVAVEDGNHSNSGSVFRQLCTARVLQGMC